MATAGHNITLTSSPTTLYDPAVDGLAAGISISVRSGVALVNMATINEPGDWFGITPCGYMGFGATRRDQCGLVQAKTEDGAPSPTVIDFTVIR